MKKFLSLLLAAMMILSVMPVTVLADGMEALDLAPVGEVLEEADPSVSNEVATQAVSHTVEYDGGSVEAVEIGTCRTNGGEKLYLAQLPYGATNISAGDMFFTNVYPRLADRDTSLWVENEGFLTMIEELNTNENMNISFNDGFTLPTTNVKGFFCEAYYSDGQKAVIIQVASSESGSGEGWDGTTVTEPAQADGVYQIGTAEELAWFAAKVNDGTAAAANAVLTADIDLNNKEWTPIGNYPNRYVGNFNGQNHTVKNMSITVGAEYIGLFGFAAKRTIENITVEGKIDIKDLAAQVKCGGLIGYLCSDIYDGDETAAGKVINCVSKVDITVSGSLKQTSNFGGLIGSTAVEAKVIGCAYKGNIYCGITHKATQSWRRSVYVAGIVGNANDSIIENCYNNGTVIGKVFGRSATMVCGGISNFVGISQIQNCYSTGGVSAEAENGVSGCTLYCGGVLGYLTKNPKDAYPANCNYLEGSSLMGIGSVNDETVDDATSGFAALTAEKLKSAEFLAKLNAAESLTGETVKWTVGEDGYPVISNNADEGALVVSYDGGSVTAERIGEYMGFATAYLASLPYGATNPKVPGAETYIPEEAPNGEDSWMKNKDFEEAITGLGVAFDDGKTLPTKDVKGFAVMCSNADGMYLVIVQVSTAAPATEKTIGVDGVFTLTYVSSGEGKIEEVGTAARSGGSGKAYVITLPEDAEIKSFAALQETATFSGIGTKLHSKGIPTVEEYIENEKFETQGPQYKLFIYNATTFKSGYQLPIRNVKGFGVYIQDKTVNSYDTIFVQIEVKQEGIGMEGEGTEESPYIIRTSEDLAYISKECNNGDVFKRVYFKFADDIDSITLPANWTPIGTSKTGFSGNINGNGKTLIVPKNSLSLIGVPKGCTIENLSIYGEKIPGYGLVEGYTTSCTGLIKNITIKSGSHILKSGLIGGYGNESVNIYDCTVEKGVVIGDDGTWGDLALAKVDYMWATPIEPLNGQDMIGSFCGAWNGTITGCVSYATVYGRNYVGGIVGFKGQSMRKCIVNNCAFYGDIIATGEGVGGIVGSGYLAGSAPNSPCVTIENCYATGSIQGKDKVGGIFGGELGVKNNWGNGIGRVRGNYFSGTVSATGEDATFGGVIGFMKSMDLYNDVENNYFAEDCGAANGIGAVEVVFNADKVDYNTYTKYGRDDDPMTSEKVTKKVTRAQVTNGELVKLLNSGEYGRNNWQQGAEYPVFGEGKHVIGITSINSYDDSVKGPLEANPPISIPMEGGYESLYSKHILVKYSDGTQEEINASEGEFGGIDFTDKERIQLAHLTYKNYKLTFGVELYKSATGKMKVSIQILGDSAHGTDGTVHTIKGGNLTEWFPMTEYEVYNNQTVRTFINNTIAQRKVGVTITNPGGNYITAVEYNGNKVSAGDNGENSCWQFTINGVNSALGIAQQDLHDGDVIVLYYTDDYTKENPTANYDEVAAVKAAIEAIGEVTLTDECKAKIDAARAAYDKLSEDAKTYIDNYKKLTDAEAEYARLLKEKADKEAAKAVDNLIAAIGKVEFTDECKAKIDAARKAFNALTPEQKAFVKNEKVLTDAEAEYERLKKAAEDEAAAKAVDDLIAAIGEVEFTDASKAKIDAARAAYDKLTDAQKKLVKSLKVLTDAEAEYERLKKAAEDKAAAKAVDDLITAIGEVKLTEECDAKIKAARKAFNALTPEQKAFVKNEKVLTDAEAEYQKLFDQRKADEAAAKAVDEAVAKLAPVTLESGKAIEAARKAFDELTPAQRELLKPETENNLKAAEAEYARLVKEAEDKAAAKAVDEKVAAIGEVTLTDESKAKIDEARKAFDALTPEQKKFLASDTESKLVAAENEYKRLVKEAADKAAAKEVEDLINAIGTPITKNSKAAIDAARTAYEALTPEQKDFVSEEALKKLIIYEKAYAIVMKNEHENDRDDRRDNSSVIHITAAAAAKGEQNPHTGAPAMSIAPAMLVLAAAVLVLKKHG